MKRLLNTAFFIFLCPVFAWAEGDDVVLTQTLNATEEMLSAKAVYLRAEDVDTFCDIRLNGHYVGATSNFFRRWQWDVKPYLRAGENVLEGTFHDAEAVSEKKNSQRA